MAWGRGEDEGQEHRQDQWQQPGRHGEVAPRDDGSVSVPAQSPDNQGPDQAPRQIEVYSINPGTPVHVPGAPQRVPGRVSLRRSHLMILVVLLVLAIAGAIGVLMTRPGSTVVAKVSTTTTPTATEDPTPSATATPPPTGTTQSASSTATPSPSGGATTPAAGGTTAGTPGGSQAPTSTDAPTPANTTPFQGNPLVPGSVYLGGPVDGNASTGKDVQMSGKDYPNSTTVYCGQGIREDWTSVGYTSFTTITGFDDQAPNSTGVTFTVTFYDQDMHQLARVAGMALGHPKAVTVNVRGTTRLIVECTLQNSHYDALLIALGDAALNP